MENKSSILAVGSLAFDSIETPSGKAEGVLGGSVNYFSMAASFYAPVSVVGVVGEDFPRQHLDYLATRKIDVSGIKMVPGKTFHWVGSYDQNLNEAKTLATALNVFEHFDPRLSENQKKSRIVFLANIDPVLQLSVLDQVEQPDFVACDTMNFWIGGKPDELKKTLKRVDLISLNEGEAYLLSGKKNIPEAARAIQALGPRTVIIKRGEYGAACFSGGSVFLAPAYLVDRVIDPTGAGDSFAGAMMGYLAEAGANRQLLERDPQKWQTLLRRAVLAGCVMASFTVEDFSLGRLKRLSSDELVSRGRAMLQMISV